MAAGVGRSHPLPRPPARPGAASGVAGPGAFWTLEAASPALIPADISALRLHPPGSRLENSSLGI